MPDFKPDGFQIAAKLVIPETQHLDSMLSEELISSFISRSLVWESMSSAVQFDGEFRHRAIDVEEVDAAGVLASEFESVEATVAEQTPKPLFGIRGFCAELSGKVAGGGNAGAVFAVF